MRYNGPDGGVIKNLGERDLQIKNEQWKDGKMTMQVGDKINKLLAAVSQIGQAGNKVVFYDDDGKHRIIDKKSGETTEMYERDGTFKTDIWVWNPDAVPPDEEGNRGFQGQGKW